VTAFAVHGFLTNSLLFHWFYVGGGKWFRGRRDCFIPQCSEETFEPIWANCFVAPLSDETIRESCGKRRQDALLRFRPRRRIAEA
jgi:hypothetical protein